MNLNEIKQAIEQALFNAYVEVDGDGTHFQAIVVSTQFEGISTLQQHRTVYSALGDKMGKEVHALSIRTFTPDEWEQQKGINIIS